VPGSVPAVNDLSYGQLAINYADGKLFARVRGADGLDKIEVIGSIVANLASKFDLDILEGQLLTAIDLAVENVAPSDLSSYLKISDIPNVLQICKGAQDPRSLGLNVAPGFTWIEVGAMGEPVMSWQYATILGSGRWVSNYLGSMSYYSGNISASSALFPLDGYALPFDLLPCYVSGYAQNGHVATPGGTNGTTDSNQTYWTFDLKPWPDASTTPVLATFNTRGINWSQTGIALAALVPCQPFVLQTQAIGGTKDYRTFFLKATKSGTGQLGLNQFSWTLSYRFVRR
jgi:hypothetical protein